MLRETSRMREALTTYIEATYHLSDPKLVAIRRELLRQPGGVSQQPYVESTAAYETGAAFSDLQLPEKARELLGGLGRRGVLFDPPYTHQAEALERATARDAGGSGLVVTTGTGSGKTEAFLLPILARLAEEAGERRDRFGERAVRSLLLYPMNALVNDQLGRLRNLFGAPAVCEWFTAAAGRPAKFGRYTGRTLYPGVRSSKSDRRGLESLGYYLSLETKAQAGSEDARDLINKLKDKGRWPGKPDSRVGRYDGLTLWYGSGRWTDREDVAVRAVERTEDPELLTRHEIQRACPDVLVTNYSMLEYMLLRPIERSIFEQTRDYFARHRDERFLLVLDEAHLYRGANGTEVAYLLRRLLDRLGLEAGQLVTLCTSASFSASEAAAAFAARLTGTPAERMTPLGGAKRAAAPSGPGDQALAGVLAGLPLEALQHADMRDRSAVLAPLLARRPGEAAPVRLRRTDAGAPPLAVRVEGLDSTGRPQVEVVETPSGGEAATSSDFSLLYSVSSTGGRLEVRRVGEAVLAELRPDGELEWKGDDLSRALWAALAGEPVLGRARNLTAAAPSPTDPVADGCTGPAWALDALPRTLFPDADGETARRAADALLELASLAREAPGANPLLPARVHLLFRGLPGLWACVDPQCAELPADQRGGPTGRLYAEPRRRCGCGAVVLELHSCRNCGIAVAHGFVASPLRRRHVWQDDGAQYGGEGQDRPVPAHFCLEDPGPGSDPSQSFTTCLDTRTARIDPHEGRDIWVPKAASLFPECPRCGTAEHGISNHHTRGEQPLQELVSTQVLEQPPRPDSRTPLEGRKALVFSDGRQSASRLAGIMKTYAFRDSVRPLLLAGMAELDGVAGYRTTLDDAPLALVLGAARHKVRLRPSGDSADKLDQLGAEAADLLDDDEPDIGDLQSLRDRATHLGMDGKAVFAALYAVLQDQQTGLEALALAGFGPRLSKKGLERLQEVPAPPLADVSEATARAAAIDLWLWAALRARAVLLKGADPGLEKPRGSAGYVPWSGRFNPTITKALKSRGLKDWLDRFLAHGVPLLSEVPGLAVG